MKFVRDKFHAKKIGEELIVDIAHYRKHQNCKTLWNVVFDPKGLIQNPDGLIADVDGKSSQSGKSIHVRTLIV